MYHVFVDVGWSDIHSCRYSLIVMLFDKPPMISYLSSVLSVSLIYTVSKIIKLTDDKICYMILTIPNSGSLYELADIHQI